MCNSPLTMMIMEVAVLATLIDCRLATACKYDDAMQLEESK